MARTHRPRRRHRLPAAFVAALAVILQLGGSLHYLLVEHVHCAAHGEVAHGEHPHAGAPDEERRDVDEVGAAGADVDARHEHCPMAVERRSDGAVASGRATSCAPPACSAAVEPATAARTPSVALYLLAPKSSPPV